MRISVNYEQLMQQSQCLYVKADEYHQIIESIQQRIHGMASIWQGEDHLMFVSKFDELYPKLNHMTQVLEEYASLLQKSASMYQQIQQDRIAQARMLG